MTSVGTIRSNRYRWLALAAGCLAQMTYGLAFIPGLASIGPAVARHFAVDLIALGGLFSALQLGVALGLGPWGFVVDRLGDGRSIAVGMAGAAAALVVASFTSNFWLFLFELATGSFLGAAALTSAATIVTHWFPPGERGVAMGMRQMALVAGAAIAAGTMPALITKLGLARLLVTLAVVSVVSGAVGLIALRAMPAEQVDDQPHTRRRPIRDGRLWRLLIGSGALIFGQNALLPYLVVYLTVVGGLPLAAAAAGFLASQIAGAALRVGTGILSDRIGMRVVLIQWSGAGVAVLMLCMVVVKSPPTLLALPVLVTALSLLMAPNGLTYVASADIVGPANASATIGTVLSYFALLGVAAPISFGWLVGHAGWEPGFAVLLACAVLSWLVLNPLTRLEAARWVGASR